MQRNFAAILDFHSVWYRDDLVQPRVKLEQLYFGLTGPIVSASGQAAGAARISET